jgi:hypothetical protein
MNPPSVVQRSLATSLALLLVSCSATRPSTVEPTGSQDLVRYALVVEEAPDGKVTHRWKPLENFDLTDFQHSLRARSSPRGIVRVSTDRKAYCAGRRQQCETDCFASSKPFPVGHLRYPSYLGPWRLKKGRWCRESCGMLEDMCNRGMGEWAEDYATEFDTSASAVDWIKNHRAEILVGTVIVIAGVAFVAVAAAAAGALVLVPLVLLADAPSEPSPAALVVGSSP